MNLKFAVRSLLVFFAGAGLVLSQQTNDDAHVTKIIKDVKLLPPQEDARPAALNDKVDQDTGVKTGDQSRSELTFTDLTITRLGANTVFSFNKAGRNVQLDSGAILVYVPKNSGGARISNTAATVGISGTTLIFESTPTHRSKLTVLEGGAHFSLNRYSDKSALVKGGQMLDVENNATKLPQPQSVDVRRIMKTNPLITDFPPLPSQNLILAGSSPRNSSPRLNSIGGNTPSNQPVYTGQPVSSGGGPPIGLIPPILFGGNGPFIPIGGGRPKGAVPRGIGHNVPANNPKAAAGKGPVNPQNPPPPRKKKH